MEKKDNFPAKKSYWKRAELLMTALSVCIRFIKDWDTDVNESGIGLVYMIQQTEKGQTVL